MVRGPGARLPGWGGGRKCFCKTGGLEARAGIEPACTDLQSATSPLRHRAFLRWSGIPNAFLVLVNPFFWPFFGAHPHPMGNDADTTHHRPISGRVRVKCNYKDVVPLARLERAHLSILHFECSASTNSTTGAA